jgi:cell division protein FtsI/penicillin-binding protein 2
MFLLSGGVLLLKLFYWQVLAGDRLTDLALAQQQTTIELPARRGEIVFADGSFLVANQPSFLAYFVRNQAEVNPETVAEQLAPILFESFSRTPTPSAQLNSQEIGNLIDVAQGNIADRIADQDLSWIPLGRKLTLKQKTALEELEIPQLYFEFDQKRLYPEASMAAHLTGFIGSDEAGRDLGYHGLEGYYHQDLSGRPGIIRQEKDAFNQPILMGQFAVQQKKDGRQLKLHLDKSLQFMVENRLKKAVDQFGAKAGSVTVMDPKTGGILAMASLPSYSQEEFGRYDASLYLNPVVSDAFEPGSIFKVIVMAAALDAGVVKPDTICDICEGPIKIDKYTINTWNDEYRPNSNLTDVLVNSDNVGMVFTGQKLELNNFLNYFHRFGFGSKTGVDLQDEVIPVVKDDHEWTFVDLATASFGQGFLATGMQLLKAVAVIANDGEMVGPQMVNEVISEDRNLILPTQNQGRVISKEAADQITSMMVAAAKTGEAQWTNVPGYQIAGKTGTAQVAGGGKYDSSKTNASFIGFAPADDPKFVMLVTLKEPSTSPWASETAAPLWFGIAQQLLNHFNVIPNQNR